MSCNLNSTLWQLFRCTISSFLLSATVISPLLNKKQPIAARSSDLQTHLPPFHLSSKLKLLAGPRENWLRHCFSSMKLTFVDFRKGQFLAHSIFNLYVIRPDIKISMRLHLRNVTILWKSSFFKHNSIQKVNIYFKVLFFCFKSWW